MYFFSIHPNIHDVGNHALYAKGWTVKPFESISALAEACCKHLNSPIVWTYGIRRASNFLYSDFVVVDVDDDSKLALNAAIDRYSGYVHAIGITKSHLRLKGNFLAERYRVFIACERRIEMAEVYKQLCLQQAWACGGDWQASGAHMQFMPLREIVSYSEVGKKLSCDDLPIQQTKPRPSRPEGGNGIPSFIQRWLDGEVRAGERNITVFKIACGLLKRNFVQDEIIELVLRSSLPLNPESDKTKREVRNAVKSAYRARK